MKFNEGEILEKDPYSTPPPPRTAGPAFALCGEFARWRGYRLESEVPQFLKQVEWLQTHEWSMPEGNG